MDVPESTGLIDFSPSCSPVIKVAFNTETIRSSSVVLTVSITETAVFGLVFSIAPTAYHGYLGFPLTLAEGRAQGCPPHGLHELFVSKSTLSSLVLVTVFPVHDRCSVSTPDSDSSNTGKPVTPMAKAPSFVRLPRRFRGGLRLCDGHTRRRKRERSYKTTKVFLGEKNEQYDRIFVVQLDWRAYRDDRVTRILPDHRRRRTASTSGTTRQVELRA